MLLQVLRKLNQHNWYLYQYNCWNQHNWLSQHNWYLNWYNWYRSFFLVSNFICAIKRNFTLQIQARLTSSRNSLSPHFQLFEFSYDQLFFKLLMSSNYALYRYVIILLPHIETNFYMVPIQLRLRNALLLAEIIG